MKGTIVLFLIFLMPTVMIAQVRASRSVIFNRVTLIDVKDGRLNSEMTLVVTGNRISAIGRAGKVRVPKDAEVVDASGKFLIPGLWDMHSHFLFESFREPFIKLLVANGITGVRDLGGEQLEQLNQIRQSITEGRVLGPRLVAAGPIVDGPKPVWEFSIPVANAEDGRKAVRTLKEKGADFVKVYSLLSRESYFAIADEAKKQKIPFAGHVPNAVTTAEATDAGQKSIEHIRIYLDVSTDEKELRRERLEAEAKGLSEFNKVRGAQTTRILNTISEEKVRQLAERFTRNGTWFVPTLTVHRGFAFLNDAAFTADSRLKYMPEVMKSYWKTQREQTPEEVTKRNRLFYTKDLQLVGLMHSAGARLLAGSDMMNPYVYPGFSLHDELALLVEAGLTPLEALRTATINPAIFLEMEKSLGTIEKGKLADLVLLDANPLEDIKNTTRIAGVVVNGKYLPKSELEKLLAQAEAAVKK
jgi:imidazolonepropionase-like amidohydrolase